MKTKDDILENKDYLNHDRLRDRRKFAIADLSGRGKDVVFEINWNKFSQRKGYIKISINGVEAVVAREQLWAILFMLGSAEEQEKLVSPFVKQTKVLKFSRLVGVTAMETVPAGMMINVPLEFTYNPETQNIIIGKGTSGNFTRKVRGAMKQGLL